MKKVLRFLSILSIVTILLLTFTSASDAGKGKVFIKKKPGKGPLPEKVWNKITGPLKDAVKIYRKRAAIEKKDLFTSKKSRVKSDRQLGHTQTLRPFLSDALVDPKVQKRWKNPPYDVLKCLIKMSGKTDVLKKFNLKIRTVSDLKEYKILSVEISALDIEKVAMLPSVISITPITKKELTCDLATSYTGASAIRLKQGDEFDESTKGYSGKGVIIGLVDTGVDPTHEDLRDENGTRILYYWDPLLETPGKTPKDVFGGVLSGLDFGTVWTKEDIDAGLCTSTDDYGHGTHIAGVAAGRGRVTEKYAGMAPNADIIMVKEDYTNNGVLFIYELSKRSGKPCVVNLGYTVSLSLHMISLYPDLFPADGTGAASLEIKGWNNSYGPGHIPVKSAGNYGHWNAYTNSQEYPYKNGAYHAEAPLSSPSAHVLQVPNYGDMWAAYGWIINENDYATVQIGMWYESPVQVTFISPNGNTIGPMVHGTSGTAADNISQDGVVNYVLDNNAASNGHYYGTFELGDFFWTRFYPQPGEWQVLVEPIGNGTGNMDMWCCDLGWYYGSAYPATYSKHPEVIFTNGTHAKYIIDEAVSPDVIAVGGWVTKDQWIGTDGETHTFPEGYILGSVLKHSSPGPARNGAMKPDIAAPATVVGPLTGDYFFYGDYIILQGEKYAIFSGNSAAAPVVVGGIALILEKYPGKSFSEIKKMIKDFAIQDSFTNQYGRSAFGYGKFNIKPLNDKPVAVVTARLTDEHTIVFDASASFDPEEFPLTYHFKVETQAVSGSRKPKAYTFTIDGAVLTLVPDPNIGGNYRVKLRVNDSITNSEKVYSQWILVEK